MPRAVLAKDQIAAQNSSLDRRKHPGAEILFAKQPVNWTRGDARHKCASGVYPSVRVSDIHRGIDQVPGAEKYRTRSTHRDQFVGIDRQVAPLQRTGILQKVAGHPVVFVRARHVLHEFPKIPAVQFGAAFSGGAHKGDRRYGVRTPW